VNTVPALRKLLLAPIPATATYCGILILLLFVIVSSVQDILDARADVAASAAMLEQLGGHRSAVARAHPGDVTAPSGSPFLEGGTMTVAGAALLQRVAGAVTRLGGEMVSSQIELPDGRAVKDGRLSIIASCEIGQQNLQPLIYDLEAGMPFLFIEQLSVQAPTSTSGAADGKLRLLLTVSGQWQGDKS
jgi:general secretion pathway protein M